MLVVFWLIPMCALGVFPLVFRQAKQSPLSGAWIKQGLRKEFLLSIPFAIGAWAVVALFEIVVTLINPEISFMPEHYEFMLQYGTRADFIELFILGTTVGPVAEELFFRGYLFNKLRGRMPFVVAMVIQALIFGYYHMLGVPFAMSTAVMGCWFTMVYWWRKSIVAAVLAHAIHNAFAIIYLISIAQFEPLPANWGY